MHNFIVLVCVYGWIAVWTGIMVFIARKTNNG
jgi:hypothetical protein